MKSKSAKGYLLLLTTAVIWGFSFVAQSVGMESVQAFTYNGIRTLMGALALLCVILIKDKCFKIDKDTLIHGSIMGLIFFFASNLQQFAFYYSTAGKIAFITAMYIFFVPILSIIFKKKVHPLILCCVLISIIGLYFLCIPGGSRFEINKGDLLALCCAVFFSFHIMSIDKFSPMHDGLKLSCTQFFVAGSISVICMYLFETPTMEAVSSASIPLLYSGIMSCGVAYTLQILGQKNTNPTIASILMCLESVFAVIAAAIIIKEIPTLRETIGCIIMFIAIILSQIIEGRANLKKDQKT